MSQRRKEKLKKREEHRQRAERKKHDLFDGALCRAGLRDNFGRLPPLIQSNWRANMQPTPEIVIDPSAEGCEYARGIQRDLPQYLRRPITLRGQEVSSLDMLCVLLPLKNRSQALVNYLRKCGDDLEAGPCRPVVEFGARLQAFMERQESLLVNDFTTMVSMTMLHNTQLYERIMWVRYAHSVTPAGKIAQQIVVHKKVPDRVKISVDGLSRPAVRCCLPGGPTGLIEITWKARDIGFTDDPREYPVYVQSHVFEQLERRVPYKHHIFNFINPLLGPKFHRTTDNHFLVEFWHLKDKIGYLVGVRLDDCVLLKTFLFLTMQGTPESDLLYRKLRLTRSDIEFMQLDELAAFRDRAVRNDPVLIKVFEECGCGHLLRMTDASFSEQSPAGYAESLHKYLGPLDHIIAPPTPPPTTPSPDDLHGLTLWGQKL